MTQSESLSNHFHQEMAAVHSTVESNRYSDTAQGAGSSANRLYFCRRRARVPERPFSAA